MMNFIAIIPARYQSTRFPGKPLVMLGDKPIIRWVYENSQSSFPEVWVATDDQRIFDAVKAFGGNAVMTDSMHQSGTDRCAEAARHIAGQVAFDVVVNVQGDEPFVQQQQLEALKACFNDPKTEIATLVKPITDPDELTNSNRPKVVINNNMEALYFSRSTIPFVRDAAPALWLKHHTFYSHIGLYAYRAEVLQQLTKLPRGGLEKAESLEQLRWLENGFCIKTALTASENMGIDTPADLEHARRLIHPKS